MRDNMRGGQIKTPYKIGDVVRVREEVGSKKGQYLGQFEITHIRPRAKSYFVRNIDNGKSYLRSQDRIKIDPSFKPPQMEVKSVILICPKVSTKSILKKPGSKSTIRKNVSFDTSFYTARIIAKQSIKEWKKVNKEGL